VRKAVKDSSTSTVAAFQAAGFNNRQSGLVPARPNLRPGMNIRGLFFDCQETGDNFDSVGFVYVNSTVGSETSFTPDSLCFYFSDPQ
jgi:hypothetical protein